MNSAIEAIGYIFVYFKTIVYGSVVSFNFVFSLCHPHMGNAKILHSILYYLSGVHCSPLEPNLLIYFCSPLDNTRPLSQLRRCTQQGALEGTPKTSGESQNLCLPPNSRKVKKI